MAETMSDERLAACCDLPQLIRRHTWTAAEDAADAIRDLADEVKRLRAQLAEIGETREEWAADGPAGWFQWPAGARSEWSERFARGVVEGAATKGVEVKLKRRLVGEWREVEQ